MYVRFNYTDLDDPYSSTIDGLKKVLNFGLDHNRSMSEAEYNNLKAIEELIRRRDNA